ncbi:hypothetical protein GCM10014715_08840 [Streptomyces spiralis]|uniref:Uncharacterized protein n=1 Tax=Streptomyces spiralis TaxID=66376 RepID=A0A918ZLY9_9ACTN|nr:hypothetical protein [Streptomyces spiralis]GHE58136.1 hypothetical protein GCM10014715_08840 [Streptomyces spiralis]
MAGLPVVESVFGHGGRERLGTAIQHMAALGYLGAAILDRLLPEIPNRGSMAV